ncbi:SgcJ/EcaC family oxidoreductase [Streptomyces sp. NPDC001822]|uniref:SgcJ/EcaC family oxidoreductase n=1 Tax=Streptomyces sp. NPDC001822 TaxID=3364614 RepID=UPI0036A308BD
MDQSVEAMSAVPGRMYEAWNRGDVAGFFADFAEDALFADLEGTIYRSRAEMISRHEELIATVVKGSRLVKGDVPFARIISPGVGVVHGRVGMLLPGEEHPPPTRFSMQLFVMVWRDGRWVVVALENARLLSMESMAALESLSTGHDEFTQVSGDGDFENAPRR